MFMNTLEELEKLFPSRIRTHVPLAPFTTIKIGGPADIFFEAKTSDELIDAVKIAKEHNTPYFILGGGTNILIGDRGIRGLVIRNLSNAINIKAMKGGTTAGVESKKVYVQVDSGVALNVLVRWCIEHGLAGLQMHQGLPGSVGGAIYMNSKWTVPESYVGDCVYQADILGADSVVRTEQKSYFRFAYDTSILQKTRETVVRVIFSLTQSDPETLKANAADSMNYRKQSQPQGIFSMGCTFQNISKAAATIASTPNLTTSAGFLIDHAGLKGKQVGGAQVSPVHANFIVNTGKATACDVVALIDQAKAAVLQKYNIELKEEIVRVGEF